MPHDQNFYPIEEKTLRDELAMAALPETYQAHIGVGNQAAVVYEAARVAYLLADACLEARKK